MVCTFFGHKDAPQEIQVVLQSAIVELIEKQQVNIFYVGNQGKFDFIVQQTLKKLKEKYAHIKICVVLAYIPYKEDTLAFECLETIYPEGLEKVPPKYAILRRNSWLVECCDFVITYVQHSWGGAAQFKELAEKRGEQVINLYEKTKKAD